ncbi:nucleotidyltransferase domain-containing protein [Zobellia nedashkovskayae]|uniref:nucleotidyltransferase domain-containing protein n=1 Tax=Zobellia nedashkovskayae TaxID=2779510 RepID=UPI00188C39BF|nr:nucleotidyltransferase domain-containing protein [Zobellia nedashkovskayae]
MLDTTLKKIINYSVEVTAPEKIILFGSMASGKQNVHSDIDLLLITNAIHEKINVAKQISDFISELALKSDILIHSEVEIEKASLTPFSFLNSIVKKGKVIYKKHC